MNSEIARIIDEATAEAKKSGNGLVDFAHVWAALLRTDETLDGRFAAPDPPLDEQLAKLPKTWETPTIGPDLAEVLASLEKDGGGVAGLVTATAERVHAIPSEEVAQAGSGASSGSSPTVPARTRTRRPSRTSTRPRSGTRCAARCSARITPSRRSSGASPSPDARSTCGPSARMASSSSPD